MTAKTNIASLVILSLCGLRNIGCGVIACIFFELVFFKGFTQIHAVRLQLLVLMGELALYLFIASKKDKIGIVNLILIGCLLKLISGLVFFRSQNFWLIAGVSLFGLFPVTGGDSVLLTSLSQSVLDKDSQNGTTFCSSRTSSLFKSIQELFQTFGAVLAFLHFYYLSKNCQNYYHIWPNAYYSICVLELLLALLLKLPSIRPTLNSKAKCQSASQHDQRQNKKSLLFWVFQSFSEACLTQTYVAYFLSERYPVQFKEVCLLVLARNIFTTSSGWLCQLSIKLFGKRFTIGLKFLSNILLMMVASDVGRYQPAIGIVCFIFSVIFSRFNQFNKTENIVEQSQQKQCQLSKSVGLILGISVNGYCMLRPSFSYVFAAPFLISGVVRMILDIFALRCYNKTLKDQPQVVQLSQVQSISLDKDESEVKK